MTVSTRLAAAAFLAVLSLAAGAAAAGHRVGLGAVLTTSDGGQIFGFDIDRGGADGVLASAQTIDDQGDARVSMQTFDTATGKITKTFARHVGLRNEYAVDGIFAGDVALVTHFVTPPGTIYAKRFCAVMNPVTGRAFTGAWTPPLNDIDILQAAPDQTDAASVLFGIELKRADKPVLIVSDIARDTFARVIHLDPALFGLADGPQLGAYTAANQAVFALSPDAGAVGGQAPLNILIDLATGASTRFVGYNLGPFHAGSVNGLAVDPNTGVAATTTELNAQVEFYDLARRAGIAAVQLPCTGDADQGASGSGIAVDPVHRLFLVTERAYCDGRQGSALVVYDERGRLVETITGFTFAIGEPAPAIDPARRMGWAFGPGFSQLQQFFY